MKIDYYSVLISIEVQSREKQLDFFYRYEATARDVADFVKTVNLENFSGTINVIVGEHKGEEAVETPAGLRLKATPQGKVTIIQEEEELGEVGRDYIRNSVRNFCEWIISLNSTSFY